ncbi:MAG: type VI secretion system protein TssL, long form [Geminicoccaceae bacterium]
MSQDDPFGLNDPERTRIARPQPGGRGPAMPAAPQPPRPGSGAPLPEGTSGRGPLVQAAFGLLMLAPRLRSRLPPSDPAVLRQRVEAELARYEDRAHGRGVDSRLVRIGHYALCALIDDSVLNTPWGAHGAWKSESLAGTLHHDVAAGERFFEVLDQARRAPERQRPLLELLAACLAMGFEGRYRLAPGGAAMLAGMRDDLLHQLGGAEPEELSPHWQGVAARHVALSERIPLWVYATAGLVIAAILYTGFNLRLGGYADRLGPLVAALPPAPPVDIVRSGSTAAAPAIRQVATVGPALTECLRAAGLPGDGVSEDFQKVRVRLPSAGLFNSGRAELNASYQPLLGCLGRALADEPGRVLVVGHTDSVPIRSARFPSNWELSKARAESVQAVLAQSIGDPARVATDGRADTEPVASNSDEAGRALNRRVELLLLK